ncbi:fimbria/pilus outer membrane usher protein, partial [Burkholderia pseudomallei]|uniref:fimbria/pilus outer membrane usher protein n=1 Tax=Burkholderia pseudomallei TaxID=28450 RepID=UPI003CE75859
MSQKGRIIYQTQVAAGPFLIQDLGDTVNGKLDVKVQEEDGSVNTFQVDTAYVPYLTRPGTVRYKFASGRPSNMDHSVEGPLFASTEATYGVNNGWSIYGGGLFAKDYGIGAVGIGRDLLTFGAISLDISQSKAQVREYSLSGRSYRINYSKTFSDYDSQITFAGYRFSDKDFL